MCVWSNCVSSAHLSIDGSVAKKNPLSPEIREEEKKLKCESSTFFLCKQKKNLSNILNILLSFTKSNFQLYDTISSVKMFEILLSIYLVVCVCVCACCTKLFCYRCIQNLGIISEFAVLKFQIIFDAHIIFCRQSFVENISNNLNFNKIKFHLWNYRNIKHQILAASKFSEAWNI